MIVLGGFILIYVLLVSSFVYGFQKMPKLKRKASESSINFSIIIPFRNEEKHLPALLDSISNLNYPKSSFECLFVDDESSDDSVKIIKNWMNNSGLKIALLSNQRRTKSPKKDAIVTAIEKADFEWIITTDSDCIVPKDWLQEFSSVIIKKDSKIVAGPVDLRTESNSFMHRFQELDFLSLQGSTIAGFGIGKPFMCNAANLAYQKEKFKKLNGYEGNTDIASGDDIFLFEKFLLKYPKDVHYLHSYDAVVHTSSLNSWNDIIQQRIRWASKSGAYKTFFPKLVGLIVLLGNLSLILSLLMIFLQPQLWYLCLFFWLLKSLVDMIILNQSMSFFQKRVPLFRVLQVALFYPFFTVFIALRSLISGYEWKQRNFVK